MSSPGTALAPTVVHGWLHPAPGERVHVEEALLHLRGESVLGAIPTEAPGVDELCDVVLLLDDADHVLCLVDGEVVTGPALEDFGPALVDALGVSLEVGDDFFDDGSGEVDDEEYPPEVIGTHDAGEEHPDVLVSKVVASTLPLLTHAVESGLVAAHVDGWTVALLDEHAIDVSAHAWMPSELPAVQLTRVGDERFIQVVYSATDDVPILLTRYADLEPTFDVTAIPGVHALANTHLVPDSEMHRLLGTKHFRHVSADRLAAALQTPMGEDWSDRVLAALRLPTLAADVMEGRTSVPASTRVEAQPLHRSVVEMLDRYYDAPVDEVARRTPYGRAFAALTQTPTRVVLTATVETVLGAALLVTSRKKKRGVRGLLAATGTTLLADAAGHAVLAPRKFRR